MARIFYGAASSNLSVSKILIKIHFYIMMIVCRYVALSEMKFIFTEVLIIPFNLNVASLF